MFPTYLCFLVSRKLSFLPPYCWEHQNGVKNMLEEIIKNTIQTEIGHEPSEQEVQVFMDYIEGTCSDMKQDGKRMKVVDIALAIHDCCKDCFAQCEECGEWFLTGEDWNEYAHCCRECKPYQDPDMMPGGHDYY